MDETARVLGIDACKTGWVGVTLDGDQVDAYLAPTIDEVVRRAGPVAVVAVDIPIGLPDDCAREADTEAKKRIGPLGSSVFMTPVRAAFDAADHATASAVNREVAGSGISIQAFSLKPKLLEVDRWVRQTPHRVVEVHPEVSFAQLAGAPLSARKSTWAGQRIRLRLLTDAGIRLDQDFGAAGQAGPDDILDAAVAAWTARRVARGHAIRLPAEPQVFSDGIDAAIWR